MYLTVPHHIPNVLWFTVTQGIYKVKTWKRRIGKVNATNLYWSNNSCACFFPPRPFLSFKLKLLLHLVTEWNTSRLNFWICFSLSSFQRSGLLMTVPIDSPSFLRSWNTSVKKCGSELICNIFKLILSITSRDRSQNESLLVSTRKGFSG